MPLSLSRTFVVSRAESLAGSPGTVAFSVYTYSLLHICYHTNVIHLTKLHVRNDNNVVGDLKVGIEECLTPTLCVNLLYLHVCVSESGREENRFRLRLNTLIPWAISQVAEWCWRLEAPERAQAPPRSPLTFNPLTT